jgi:UDP-N-acetylmuramate dehydrogenase
MGQPGIRGQVVKNASMRKYTSMKVGGIVPYLLYPRDEEDVSAAIGWFRHRNLPFRFLGNGTNVIVADGGLNMGVIRTTRIRHLQFKKTDGGAVVEVAAGVPLKLLISQCAERRLSGIEKLYGIPGTVGGAIKMNAGSFGVSISDCLTSVKFVGLNGVIRSIGKKDIKFGYRTSSFCKGECILAAVFELRDADQGQIRADMDYVWHERQEKHPMELPSAGSVFKNKDGNPSWRYIDQAGLRGFRIGDACISEKHPNFIVNMGNASASDIKRLIETVKKRVQEATGVTLEEEVELWGFNGQN